ncbi:MULTISPECIES: DUF917 domain-containing protein [Pseudonocardia]|uniref:DUF917 domain-containing protein n=2 Tax=Pseudonocardia TaxID=1847 RepID=A0A1Y2MIM1_PSEAH|nr:MULTISPECIES: DUF917 domain-containing protein [Pseudonocardia]OSY35125.1 hypothetical protein BG845_06282 [Pseudonocardia autotrophica]TDN72143.1 hypothetical protein C8E95_1192 [Pseudonocardia autotrophica]BBG02850.1 hypothetical protein Pdca_40590 [Pseudonocardia autotrophica]GEC26169.1 hypothetical protein PSA01_31980 [Pseudonocardia saturnea]
MELTAADVDPLVAGLTLLGSGGGGDAGVYTHVLRSALRDRSVRLHSPAELGDAPVTPVGMLGGTRVLNEKLPSGRELADAVRALVRWTGVQPAAVMPLEAAGLNGVLPIPLACELGLPLVDADLMGRALPRVDQLTRIVSGGSVTPMALVEPVGRTVVVDGGDPVGTELTVRSFVAQAGGWAGTAMAAAPASDALHDACLGTLGRALRLGRAHAGLGDTPAPERVAAALEGFPAGAGRVVDVRRAPGARFGRATVTVDGGGTGVLRVEAENEYLLVLTDGEPVAASPELIVLLHRRSAAPIATDAVRTGDDVLVLVLPAPPWWAARADAHRHVGPEAFGLGRPVAPEAIR